MNQQHQQRNHDHATTLKALRYHLGQTVTEAKRLFGIDHETDSICQSLLWLTRQLWDDLNRYENNERN